MKEPKAGEKFTEQEAKEYVDHLYKGLYKYAHDKIYKGAFMTQLRDGNLPAKLAGGFAVACSGQKISVPRQPVSKLCTNCDQVFH